MLQRPSPLSPISGNTMPRTNGAIPIDIVQHAPGVIHASVVESVAAIPPLGSFMLSSCPIQDNNAANSPSGLSAQHIYALACPLNHLACHFLCLWEALVSQARSSAQTPPSSDLLESDHRKTPGCFGGKRFTDKRQAPRDGCRVRRGEISRIVREPRTITLFRSAHFRN